MPLLHQVMQEPYSYLSKDVPVMDEEGSSDNNASNVGARSARPPSASLLLAEFADTHIQGT